MTKETVSNYFLLEQKFLFLSSFATINNNNLYFVITDERLKRGLKAFNVDIDINKFTLSFDYIFTSTLKYNHEYKLHICTHFNSHEVNNWNIGFFKDLGFPHSEAHLRPDEYLCRMQMYDDDRQRTGILPFITLIPTVNLLTVSDIKILKI